MYSQYREFRRVSLTPAAFFWVLAILNDLQVSQSKNKRYKVVQQKKIFTKFVFKYIKNINGHFYKRLKNFLPKNHSQPYQCKSTIDDGF